MGSLNYCAPEVLRRVMHSPIVADIWSLGVVFFACVNHFFPFNMASVDDWRFVKVVETIKSADCHSTVANVFALYKLPVPMDKRL